MQYRPRTLTPAQTRRRTDRQARRAARRETVIPDARPVSARVRWTVASLRAFRLANVARASALLVTILERADTIRQSWAFRVRCPYRRVSILNGKTVAGAPCDGKLSVITRHGEATDHRRCRQCGRVWTSDLHEVTS